ncbi:hypothetical protein BC826DRAFT_409575 [Russula brevipes]|nr:hypothetical protein BC826DRAFT_409575 [Russula brevipes]
MSTKSPHRTERRHVFLAHPASSPGPRHVTRPPNYPHELPSPSKRQRLSSTPSSSSLPSTPSRDDSTVDFYQARFESTMRLRDAWSQLAERYARPLDEDDIIDLREGKILKDRGVMRNFHTPVNFGDISIPDEPSNNASSEAGGVQSEDEEDFDEIDAFSHRSVCVPNQLEAQRLGAQLRRVRPLCELDSDDEDDLNEFLEAERQVREEFGPIDEDFSKDLAQLEDDVEEDGNDDEVIEVLGSSDEEDEQQDLSQMFTTSGQEDGDSEDDELGHWVHDESNAIYEVVRTPAPSDNYSDNEVIEIFDTPPSSPPPSSPPPSSLSPLSSPLPRRSLIEPVYAFSSGSGSCLQ